MIKIPDELIEESSYHVSWESVANYLNISYDDFKGEMWKNVDFVKLLSSRIDNEYFIYEVEMKDGYGQGEWFNWYKSFTWSIDGVKIFKSTRLANYWFDDNYLEFETIEIKRN